jgi:hypothetical protein
LLVQAIDSVGQTVAIALVPDAPDAAISCNGLPLGPGLHALCHGDQLQVNETPFWISVEATHDEARYDPACHGPNMFCFITKARLSESDPIVICPGTPGNSCGVICTQRAWAMARESPKPLRCPNCGYDSRQRTWRPVWGKRRDPLGELFAIIASRSAEK